MLRWLTLRSNPKVSWYWDGIPKNRRNGHDAEVLDFELGTQELKRLRVVFLCDVDEYVCGSMGFSCTMLVGNFKKKKCGKAYRTAKGVSRSRHCYLSSGWLSFCLGKSPIVRAPSPTMEARERWQIIPLDARVGTHEPGAAASARGFGFWLSTATGILTFLHGGSMFVSWGPGTDAERSRFAPSIPLAPPLLLPGLSLVSFREEATLPEIPPSSACHSLFSNSILLHGTHHYLKLCI